ncbi:BlaI/MecI/CopY family transcriptional regulator [Kutzneria sp. 744]|uniref:BlaI/MecI/CopY family transcriptional regulator n=1 Tax=Kutzneria sp. (strain 744) TaxID=345341 RepID=UPI0003EEB446|nr:BlaI/MecI/CopY family transcriptional regulator [Kutzneria sp. 744]EWM12627.1 transcriptional regulator, BlaI/MecI/CopY family [Kutzneria sp. 744]
MRRRSGELESEVLAALWAADGAMTPAQVQTELGGSLAYTTVVTILSRLHDKGVAARERQGRAYAYSPVQDEPGRAAGRMRKLLDAEPDRRLVLTRFVTDLSEEDEVLLRQLLADSDG